MALARTVLDQTFATPHGEAAYEVCVKLLDAGYDTWWVGGCVRDMLQGKVPHDIDIATSATPEQMTALFPDAKADSAHLGSMRITLHRHTFEVTTFRIDDELTDGRHPKTVSYGTREQDANRRDFTVNALYLQPVSRELYDPFNGEADLKEKLIRFIGDPLVRIQQDGLRMLRAVRFRAMLDGQYHPDTYKALREHANYLKNISGERIRLECEKMLKNPSPEKAFEDLWELGMLEVVLPELYVCKGMPQPAEFHQEGDVWNHLMQCIAHLRPDDTADVRWAALFHDIGKAETFALKDRIRFDHHASVSAELARTICKRLAFSNARRDKISWLIEHHMMMASFLEMSAHRKGHWYYHPWFQELLRLFEIDIEGTTPQDFSLLESILKDYNAFLDAHPRPMKMLLTGDEVMELLGIQPGEGVGRALKALQEAQAEGRVASKEEAEQFLRAQQYEDTQES